MASALVTQAPPRLFVLPFELKSNKGKLAVYSNGTWEPQPSPGELRIKDSGYGYWVLRSECGLCFLASEG